MNINYFFKNRYCKDLELLLLSCLLSAVRKYPEAWFEGAIALWIAFEIYLLNAEFHILFGFSDNTKLWIKKCLSLHTIVILISIYIGSFIIPMGEFVYSLIIATILVSIRWFWYIFLIKKK